MRREESNTPAVTSLGVVAPPPIQIESEHFNGSLGMLFQCVRDHKVNLLDVPLAPVCESYLLYLLNSEATYLDEAAAALIALAYLIERKAWLLLPVEEEEPQMELPLELPAATISEFNTAMETLRIFQEERAQSFYREVGGTVAGLETLPIRFENADPNVLARALARVLERAVEPAIPVHRARRSLADMMRVVLRTMTNVYLPLEEIIPSPFTREDAVYWFLSILELVRLGQIGLRINSDTVKFAKLGL